MDEDGNLRPRDQTRQQDSPAPRDPRSPQFGADEYSSRSPHTSLPASYDTRPWYLPPITPEDLDPQHHDDDAFDSHSAPKGRPEVNDLVYRSTGEFPAKPGVQDLLYRFRGSPEEAKQNNRRFYQNVADAHGSAPQMTGSATTLAQNEQQQAPASQTAPGGTSTSRASALGPNADGSGVQFLNRVQPRDESAYNDNKPPVQRLENQGSSTRNKSPEQHKKEMDAFRQAQANHEWNANSQTLKAWENFDRAVELMKRTPEGRAVWDRLNNNQGRAFQVMMVKNTGDENIYPELMRMGIRLKEGQKGRYSYVTTVNGKEQHVILLLESAMSGHTLKPDGTINPDAESLEHVWHELYHASELHPSGGIDPLKVGTSSPTDWEKNPTQPDKAPTLHPQAHERRAVRFENIIRRRNGGTRIKKLYGGELKDNGDGTSSIVNQLKVTDPEPPRPPHLPPLQVVP